MAQSDPGSKRRPRERLAQPAESLWAKPERVWDVVIVGSGYGGAAAAASFAGLQKKGEQRPLQVCVLERGQEYLPGDFPKRFSELPGHAGLVTPDASEPANPGENLFDLRAGSDVCALVANGLGGGSLINAGVLVAPEPDELSGRSDFGQALVTSLEVEHWFDRAMNVLGGRVQVDEKPERNTLGRHACASKVQKGSVLGSLIAEQVQEGVSSNTVPISIAMTDGQSSGGIALNVCALCGDCLTGCHQGAKNSLDYNLLAMAGQNGVRIFTGISVLSLEPEGPAENPMWTLHTQLSDGQLQNQQNPDKTIKARHVVLAAGTLGTSEILLRSRSLKLPLSPTLGSRFSCNGDNLAAFYGLNILVSACADEDKAPSARFVGPTITQEIQVPANAYEDVCREDDGKKKIGAHSAFRVQEFAVPGAVRRLFEEIVTTSHTLQTVNTSDTKRHGGEPIGAPDPLAVNPDLIEKTLLVGIIGHDSAQGVLQLDDERRAKGDAAQPRRVRIHWPDARHGRELEASDHILQKWARAKGASLLPNPLWKLLPGDLAELVSQPRGPVVTVHPLGGCAAGRYSNQSVTNEFGQVWNPVSGHVHKGLAVMDGSVFGHSLGANPALTITAFAMRAADHLAYEWWNVSANRLGQEPGVTSKTSDWCPLPDESRHATEAEADVPPPEPDTQVQVIERMSGEALLLVEGKPMRCMVELTLAFSPMGLRAMAGRWGRRLDLVDDAFLTLGDDEKALEVQVLRAYALIDWEKYDLAHRSDEERRTHLKLSVRVKGHMRLFDREPTTPWSRRRNAFWAWIKNRGAHETLEQVVLRIFQYSGLLPILARVLPDMAQERTSTTMCERVKGVWRLSSRAGERRVMAYELTVASSNSLPEGFEVGQAITGVKTITYDRRANPWTQLTQMKLTAMPNLLARADGASPVLKLDARFLARHGVPLVRIKDQANQAQALLDGLSFGMYMARMMVHIHLWTFRRSDSQRPRAIERLPGAIRGEKTGQWVNPEITELTVDRIPKTLPGRFTAGDPVKIRLSRYARRESKQPALVMIHGYSVSGNTFTHESIPQTAAEYFWRKGRDVWVLDLRSSTGMPTATYPWSFEQVALVDIPAALLHVRQLTGQPVDVLAHCIGCAMFSMAMLTRAADVRYARVDMGVDDWLTESQLGTLDAFNGVRKAPRHPTVNRVALSQKGPVLRYSEANVLRSFVMQTARRWFFNDVFGFQPPPDGGVATELLDRLLASLPYPAADYDAQNPFNPFRRTPWTQSRRRMDMLYGRDFNAENLAPQTLGAIDDLFGPMHMDTVAQTIHFARFNVITNQRGAGEFFTLGRLRRRWNVASTFAFHGRDNGLVDVSTNALLKKIFEDAGVELKLCVVPNMGHQDVFIGSENHIVYDALDHFFDDQAQQVPVPANARRFRVTLPWIGPRFEMKGCEVQIAARAQTFYGNAKLVLVPVIQIGGLAVPCGDQWVWSGAKKDAREWHFAKPNLNIFRGQQPNGPVGWVALFVYEPEEVGGINSRTWSQGPRQFENFSVESGALSFSLAQSLGIVKKARLHAVRRWLKSQPWAALQQAFVSLNDVQSAEDLLEAASSGDSNITFALGSCQYPAGLWDASPANQSLKHLATHANQDGKKPEDPPPIHFAIFAGDQIYADATAGLADPVRRDERFQVPHERALRQTGLRAVLRKIPTAMLLDDHEIADNWTRLAPDHPDHDSNQKKRERALEAFQLYQRMDNKFRATDSHTTADQTFVWGGLPVYLLDTRSARQPRKVGEPSHLISRKQRHDLAVWLLTHSNTPKCIVTPSLFLPRRQAHLSGHRSDAFDGYAESQAWLIDFLLRNSIHHTLFLSGDEHCSMVCQATLRPLCSKEPSIKLVSVHSSALYAPYPFANGRADNLVAQEIFVTPSGQSEVEVVATQFSPGDGYARISLTRSGAGAPQVTLWFHKTTGNVSKLGPFPF